MSVVSQLSRATPQTNPLRDAFLRWQCRVRQIAMRENLGRPDNSIKAKFSLNDKTETMGRIITVLCKVPAYSMTAEMRHIVKSIFDPAQRREKAIEFFSETYYQAAAEFSDILTATFEPCSLIAKAISTSGTCRLTFESYGQRFNLVCTVLSLARHNSYFQATWWHNMLFNPNLHPETIIFGFEPDWASSSAEPDIVGNMKRDMS